MALMPQLKLRKSDIDVLYGVPVPMQGLDVGHYPRLPRRTQRHWLDCVIGVLMLVLLTLPFVFGLVLR